MGVVVGISGGADSTALLIALAQLSGKQLPGNHQLPGNQLATDTANTSANQHSGFLIAAHFNHGLRGDESDADQQFSSDLAKRLGIQFASAQSSQPCHDEATMSALRMAFLIDTAKQHGARYIALAHSLDDNVETVLHHLMRGTGPAGLCGIGSPRNVDDDLVLVRPMLGISRDQIRSSLRSTGQSWREDSSNASVHYSRNWIRHELIPLIQSRYPSAVPAIDRAIQGQKSWRSAIDSLAETWIDQHQTKSSPATFRRDSATEAAILIAAMQLHWHRSAWGRGAMKREHWQRIADAFRPTEPLQGTQIARFDLPGGVAVQMTDEHIILHGPMNPRQD